MTPRYLLDTNVFIEAQRASGSVSLVERFAAHVDQSATAATVVHELRFGAHRMSPGVRRTQFEQFLAAIVERMPVLAYDANAARWHAAERHRRDLVGRRLPFADGQIAAIAATQRLVLVTHNLADFEDLAGVVLEDWILA